MLKFSEAFTKIMFVFVFDVLLCYTYMVFFQILFPHGILYFFLFEIFKINLIFLYKKIIDTHETMC